MARREWRVAGTLDDIAGLLGVTAEEVVEAAGFGRNVNGFKVSCAPSTLRTSADEMCEEAVSALSERSRERLASLIWEAESRWK